MSKDDIAAQTARFLADGGKITKVGTIIHTGNGTRTQAENKADIKRGSAALTKNRTDRRKGARKGKS